MKEQLAHKILSVHMVWYLSEAGCLGKRISCFSDSMKQSIIPRIIFFSDSATEQCLKLESFSGVMHWPGVLSMWHCCSSVSNFFPLQSCSYFTSNAFPLKISFVNANAPSGNINVIFKVCSFSNPQVFWYGKWTF